MRESQYNIKDSPTVSANAYSPSLYPVIDQDGP